MVTAVMMALLAGAAHAAEEGSSVTAAATAADTSAPAVVSGTSPESGSFSQQWREQRIRDREANLRALDEEQRRFDKWERSARQAVGGICADCLGGGRGGNSITIPADAIPNVPTAGESMAGFDEASAYYVVRPASPPPAPAAPVATRAAPGPSAPLDIRTPAGR